MFRLSARVSVPDSVRTGDRIVAAYDVHTFTLTPVARGQGSGLLGWPADVVHGLVWNVNGHHPRLTSYDGLTRMSNLILRSEVDCESRRDSGLALDHDRCSAPEFGFDSVCNCEFELESTESREGDTERLSMRDESELQL